MTSSNGNIFRVTGHSCGEFTGRRWIPGTKASDAELWCFLDLRPNKRLSKQSWGWWFETLSRPLWRHCHDSFWSRNRQDRLHGASAVTICRKVCWFADWFFVTKSSILSLRIFKNKKYQLEKLRKDVIIRNDINNFIALVAYAILDKEENGWCMWRNSQTDYSTKVCKTLSGIFPKTLP